MSRYRSVIKLDGRSVYLELKSSAQLSIRAKNLGPRSAKPQCAPKKKISGRHFSWLARALSTLSPSPSVKQNAAPPSFHPKSRHPRNQKKKSQRPGTAAEHPRRRLPRWGATPGIHRRPCRVCAPPLPRWGCRRRPGGVPPPPRRGAAAAQVGSRRPGGVLPPPRRGPAAGGTLRGGGPRQGAAVSYLVWCRTSVSAAGHSEVVRKVRGIFFTL